MRINTASLLAFSQPLLGLGDWPCRSQTPTETSARPLRFTPGSGTIEGGRFVFIDVEEPAAAIGTASIACQFGQHAASPGEYDATSARYLCRKTKIQQVKTLPKGWCIDYDCKVMVKVDTRI